jgi:hypothetical protein
VLLRSELRDCLARVQGVLVRAEDALGKLTVPLLPELVVGSFERVDVCTSYEQESSVVVDDEMALELMTKADVEAIVDKVPEESSEVGEDYIFGCYSPRARSCSPLQPAVPAVSECEGIAAIMAPVLHIMPELQELCGEPSPSSSLPTMHLQVDLLGVSVVAPAAPSMDLDQPLDFVDRVGRSNVAVALAPSSDALFAKELCNLLVSLEAASPGSGKEIASLLSEKATTGKIMKVKEYLKSISKKSGVLRKAPTAG